MCVCETYRLKIISNFKFIKYIFIFSLENKWIILLCYGISLIIIKVIYYYYFHFTGVLVINLTHLFISNE